MTDWPAAAIVALAAFVLFLPTATEFQPRPTDVSALRVLGGDVPYRDFWTMYAPGSFVALALVFALVGPHLIVSNLLGMLAAATAVGVAFLIAQRVAGRAPAAAIGALVAVAFYATDYHRGFTSFPPAFLLILTAIWMLVPRVERHGWTWAIAPGLVLGAAALFKHDVAGYAAIAAGVGVLATRRDGLAGRLPPVVALGAAAAFVPAAAVLLLIWLGAGPDLWQDLVVFPLGDFRWVRGQYFPLWPRLRPGMLEMAQELRLWAICNLPTLAAAGGLFALVRRWRTLSASTRFLTACCITAFVLHWSAAHVQLNTNAISLAWWGTVLAAMGLATSSAPRRGPAIAAATVVAAWVAAFLSLPVYRQVFIEPSGGSPIGLPRLAGLRTSPPNVANLHALSRAIQEAAPPDAPLLFVSARNDVVVFARIAPFWLTSRRPATRHHELHPAVTDTEAVQRRMLRDIAAGPPPVVVRDHRFDDATLDRVKAGFLEHVPVGSTLLDDWIEQHYAPGERFGAYEVMRRHPQE